MPSRCGFHARSTFPCCWIHAVRALPDGAKGLSWQRGSLHSACLFRCGHRSFQRPSQTRLGTGSRVFGGVFVSPCLSFRVSTGVEGRRLPVFLGKLCTGIAFPAPVPASLPLSPVQMPLWASVCMSAVQFWRSCHTVMARAHFTAVSALSFLTPQFICAHAAPCQP